MALGEFREDERLTRPFEFAGGIAIRLPILLVIEDQPRDGFQTQIEYIESVTGPRPGAVSVRSHIHPVNGEVLREVKVAEHGRDNLHRIATRYGRPVVPDADTIHERVDAGPKSGQTLSLVKDLFQFAELTGQPPAKYVAETLELSPATAGRWIRRSKDALLWGDRGND